MELSELNAYYDKFKYGEDNFHNLMQFRVKKILLISTIYDAYIFEHDSKLSQQIVGEYHQLNLTTVPRLIQVSTGDEALELLGNEQFDLVITTMRIGSISPFELSKKIKQINPELSVLLLLTVKSDSHILNKYENELSLIDRIFMWKGDSKIFLAMIKYIEDLKNAPYDTDKGFVRVLLLVEDSISFYSLYLPILYREIMVQTQRLIAEELNDANKYFRMRTRPKVLLATTFEEALKLSSAYSESLLGVISDIEFTQKGIKEQNAGFNLLRELRKTSADIPFLLQSSDITKKNTAMQLKTSFLYKKSHTLLKELRDFILSSLGFGDFIFTDETGREYYRIHSLKDFEKGLKLIPQTSLSYHGERDHFSSWFSAHGEFQIARRIKPVKTSDFHNLEEMRDFLIAQFQKVKEVRNRGKIIDFESGRLNQKEVIIRIGNGSLGGKGRGLAFFNAMISAMNLSGKFEKTSIAIPKTVIICTSEYDQFLSDNQLFNISERNLSDREKKQLFLTCEISADLEEKLLELLEEYTKPLAVRSSGLLEDSQSQPFAGVYHTYMLPNNDDDISHRLNNLKNAVKLVYASVFLDSALSYIDRLNFNIEEEKMAVIIQEIIGNQYNDRFYPHISGVAQSYNYYPVSSLSPHSGIASLATGLGHTVVGGEKNYIFCPEHPGKQLCSAEELIRGSQREFYALNMNKREVDLSLGEKTTLKKHPIKTAQSDGALNHLISIWDKENGRLTEDLTIGGPLVLNYSDILKYDYFPLAGIVKEILDICEKSLGTAVELEFAVDLNHLKKSDPVFYLLQVRPLSSISDEVIIDSDKLKHENIWLYSEKSSGNGIIKEIVDILCIIPELFRKTETETMVKEIFEFNRIMKRSDRYYILIGPGRWGSRDRFLGIPVTWEQISHSKVIVEAGLSDFDMDPSQGSHFFHNLISMNIGYFNIPYHNRGSSYIDWKWLNEQKSEKHGLYFRHIILDSPVSIKMDGKKGVSLIAKNS